MASLNRAQLIGRLGKDVEIRYTSSGTAVASMTIATSEKFKNKQSGEWEEKTEWHRVTLWGKLAEIAGQYLAKGSMVFIEGRLTTRKWQDKEGNDRYTTEIVGTSMQMLGGKGQSAGNAGGQDTPSETFSDPGFGPDEDIPF